jgi:TolB-like protein
MRTISRIVCLLLTPLLLSILSCSYDQTFVRGADIHSRARWVAVLPLVNLTSYPNAGRIVGDLLTTELYAQTEFQLMERTEMLEKLKGKTDDLDEVLDRSVALKVGKELGVDTLIYGSVTEYRYKRGLDEDPVVGVNIRMLDVNKGEVLWAGSESRTGGCFWLCEDSVNRLAQQTCHDMVKAMIKVR